MFCAVGGALGRYVSSIDNGWVLVSPAPMNQDESRLRSRLPSYPLAVSIGVLLSLVPHHHRQARQNDARRPSYRAALGSTSKPKVTAASSMSAWGIGSSE